MLCVWVPIWHVMWVSRYHVWRHDMCLCSATHYVLCAYTYAPRICTYMPLCMCAHIHMWCTHRTYMFTTCVLDSRYQIIGGYLDTMVWDMISMWSNICSMWYCITCMECTYTRICPCTCMHTYIPYVHTLLTWQHHVIMESIWPSGCWYRHPIPYTWYVCKYLQICCFVHIRVVAHMALYAPSRMHIRIMVEMHTSWYAMDTYIATQSVYLDAHHQMQTSSSRPCDVACDDMWVHSVSTPDGLVHGICPVWPFGALWGCVHTCYAYHRHGETLDMEDMGYVSRYPRSLKLANFLDFGILGKIRNFTKSMDFMISAHLGTILDPILGTIWTSFWDGLYMVVGYHVLMHHLAAPVCTLRGLRCVHVGLWTSSWRGPESRPDSALWGYISSLVWYPYWVPILTP